MENKFLVIKAEDIGKYLDSGDIKVLGHLAKKVEDGRIADDKSIKEYSVLDLNASIALNSLNVDISNLRMSGPITVPVRKVVPILSEAIVKED